MLRNVFCTLAALGLLVTACGDDGTGTTNTTTTASSTGGEGDTTSDPPSSSTGPDTPTTAGMSEAMTSTTNVDPSTTDVDPSTSTSTGPDPDTTSPETTSPETTSPETTDTTDSGGDPVEQCKMMADPMTECSDCVCENCLMELQECEADEGCTAIRMCAEETGCTGLDCLDVCGDVIDMYGGAFGPSGMKGLAVSMCLMGSCANQCG